jgi:hypothetical protein
VPADPSPFASRPRLPLLPLFAFYLLESVRLFSIAITRSCFIAPFVDVQVTAHSTLSVLRCPLTYQPSLDQSGREADEIGLGDVDALEEGAKDKYDVQPI